MQLHLTAQAIHLATYQEDQHTDLMQQILKLQACVKAARERGDQAALSTLKQQWQALKVNIPAQ